MLKELHIKNIILIKEIKIDFSEGLSAFTGETGAGKTILLESLAWVLGGRGSFSNIRNGAETAEVIAIFTNISNEAIKVLNENSIIYDDELIVRRIMSRDGKSKNFINNIPCSAAFLKEVGTILLDIHGQFDNQKLLNAAFHRELLDNFIANKSLLSNVQEAYTDYKEVLALLNAKKTETEALLKEQEYLEHSLKEMQSIQAKYGNTIFNEYDDLLQKKILLSNAQKIKAHFDAVNQYLADGSVLPDINKALKQLENLSKSLQDSPDILPIIQKIEHAHNTLSEAADELADIERSLDFSDFEIDKVEEKIYTLKTLANKHRIQPMDLEALYSSFDEKVHKLATSVKSMASEEAEVKAKHNEYITAADDLSKARQEAAIKLDADINDELQYLKLANAEFVTEIMKNSVESLYGTDSVTFKIRTNKGSDFGYLNKVASGGEMARFMLALKIVLSKVDTIQTIILDEIDVGVGGEVAEAIGKRLRHLATHLQTMVVTHSHQVASKSSHHFKVSKSVVNNGGEEVVESKVNLLSFDERVEEIARMISGSIISNEARATAINLLKA